VLPPFLDSQRGAVAPQEPEKAVITTSFGCRGLIAMLVSPSLNVSMNRKLGLVLSTTVSTTVKLMPAASPAAPAVFPSVKSSGTTGLEYNAVSGGELRMLSSASTDVTNPVMPKAKSTALAAGPMPLHSLRFFILTMVPPHMIGDRLQVVE